MDRFRAEGPALWLVGNRMTLARGLEFGPEDWVECTEQ
jgi:hypothetical protein